MIFVFGSNEQGIHGGGAAKVARDQYGAILHQGFGPQGNSFGIPTCHVPVGRPGWKIPFSKVQFYISCFLIYADQVAAVDREETFQVTQIGCGFAGWTKEQIAPLFALAPGNCLFDTDWHSILGSFAGVYGDDSRPRKYWGHV